MNKSEATKVKVLRILNRANVGGPTYNVAYLSKFLPDLYETKILAGTIDKDEASSAYIFESLGLSIEKIDTMRREINISNDFKSLLKIINIINEYQPDIIHTHAAKAGALGRLAALFSRHKPTLVLHTYHGNVFDGYFTKVKAAIILWVEQFLAFFTDAIIAISEKQAIELNEKYKIAKSDKIYTVPLGFDLEKFIHSTNLYRDSGRFEMGISSFEIVIVITGRITEIKNHHFFIDVIAKCKFDFNLKFKTIIVGDGNLKKEIMCHADKLGLSYEEGAKFNSNSDILFTSWRKDIDKINGLSDIAVLTSINEGTPVSLIEAMAAGKAVLSSKVGGVEDVIAHRLNGVLCELEVNSFSKELANLIENKELRIQYGQNASKSVLSKYHYSRLVTDIDNLYQKLLSKKGND